MEYDKKHYRRNSDGVVRYSPDSEEGEAANLQQRTALGKHRDGSIYLRAADADDLGKARAIADTLGVTYRQRRAGASHFGRTGSYEHLDFDTPAEALNVHAALAYHLEKNGETQGHDEHLAKLAAGLHGHIHGKDARVDGCMVNTRHAHAISLAAGKEDTPQSHKSAADLHRLSAEAHRAQAARPWTKGEGAHHAGMAIMHDAIASQHDKKAMAAHKRIQAELKRQAEAKARMEAMEEGRETKKALVHAHTRTVNGKLVQVNEYEDGKHPHAAMHDALKGHIAKLHAEADKWEGKSYKSNPNVVELNGDGPKAGGTMSVSAINEGKKKKRVEALRGKAGQIQGALDKALSDPGGFMGSVKNAIAAAPKYMEGKSGVTDEDRKDMAVAKNVLGDPYMTYGPNSAARALRDAVEPWIQAPPTPKQKGEFKDDISDIFGSLFSKAHVEGDEYVMGLDEAIKEHEELVDTLKSPSKKDDEEEIEDQGGELAEMKEAQKCLSAVGAGTDLSTLEGGGALRAEGHDEEMEDATMGREAKKGLDLDPLPEPTPGQIEAGNYKVHKISVQGLEISIENPKGSIRRGVDRDGHEWESKMAHDYGYFTGASEASDGDKPDVFVGPDLENPFVHIVNQVDPKTGRYDEMKALVGFKSREDAIEGYLANYEKGWKGLGDVKSMHVDDFKQWLKHGDLKHRLIYKAATVRLDNAARLQMQVLRCHPANRLSPDFLNTIHAAKSAGISTQEILRTISNATGAFAPLLNHLREQ